MACPLRYHPEGVGVVTDALGAKQHRSIGQCIREQCDWWDRSEHKCVVILQAEYSRQLCRLLTAWYRAQSGGEAQAPEGHPVEQAPAGPAAHTSEAYRDALGLS